jgi:hypothetical protein
MAKWTALAFVPSSLMLGVTFHMTTDIASIPLLWVGPLALYLITFIIAFGRVPSWFRILIGNLAPVMILLQVFLMISGVKPGTGLELLLYNLTFFAAALMCHYELARDRPAPQYLTTYFLIMSLGGVLGGIFNSLVAPLVFPLAYEYPLALIIACLMVPNLNPPEHDETESELSKETAGAAAASGRAANPLVRLFRLAGTNRRVALALDIVIPVLIGVAFWRLQRMPSDFDWYRKMLHNVADWLPWRMGWNTVYIVITYALPVMICFFFVDRPLRVALSVAAIHGQATLKEANEDVIHTERSFFGILKIEKTVYNQYLMDHTRYFKVTDEALAKLKSGVPEPVLAKLEPLKGKEMPRHEFQKELAARLSPDEFAQHEDAILKEAYTRTNAGDSAALGPDGKPLLMGRYVYHRLVHGTTLHGTQVARHERHVLDDFQLLTATNPWDNLAVAGALTAFDMRQEPLTYYHRTGPVGAMFNELTRRGKDREPVAMVGLGSGSVACYAKDGQKLTFYEIDPTVKRLVADRHDYFTYVWDAENRGGKLDFRLGDARLVLKHDADRKYRLLLVDAFSSDSIPVHLLTKEAVKLYLDRMTEDGILALHISNKYVQLEPVVAAIAKEHNLVARVWNDGQEGKHGKTASSWVALARTREALGDRICSPISDYMSVETDDGPVVLPGMDLITLIQRTYPGAKTSLEKGTDKQREAVLEFLDKRSGDPQARMFAELVRRHGGYTSLMKVLQEETGYGFRPLKLLKGVDAWTDDYADVMAVMTIPELQAVRKFFGLPTPVEEP